IVEERSRQDWTRRTLVWIITPFLIVDAIRAPMIVEPHSLGAVAWPIELGHAPSDLRTTPAMYSAHSPHVRRPRIAGAFRQLIPSRKATQGRQQAPALACLAVCKWYASARRTGIQDWNART